MKKFLAIALTNLCYTLANPILELISPAESEFNLESAMFTGFSGEFEANQALIGHLHVAPEQQDGCLPYSQEFKNQITTVKRSPLQREEKSSMVRNFLLVDNKGLCDLSTKVTNIKSLEVDLAIFIDKDDMNLSQYDKQ